MHYCCRHFFYELVIQLYHTVRSTLPLLSSMKFFFRWEERRRERRERASKLVNPEYQIMYVRQLFAGKKIYQCFDTKIDSNRDSSKNRIPSRYVHIITSSDLIGYKIATHYLIFSKEHSRTKVRFYFLLINLKTLFCFIMTVHSKFIQAITDMPAFIRNNDEKVIVCQRGNVWVQKYNVACFVFCSFLFIVWWYWPQLQSLP